MNAVFTTCLRCPKCTKKNCYCWLRDKLCQVFMNKMSSAGWQVNVFRKRLPYVQIASAHWQKPLTQVRAKPGESIRRSGSGTVCCMESWGWSHTISKLYVALKFSHFFWINKSFCTSSSCSVLVWFVNLLLFHHRPSFQSLFNLNLGSQNYTHTFIWHCYQYLSHLSRKHTGFHWSVTETIRLQTKNS